MMKCTALGLNLALLGVAAAGLTKHQQSMNNTEDARAEVKKALEGRAPVKAAVQAKKLEKLLEPEVLYWENLKQADAAGMARQTVALAKTLAAGGSVARMQTALDKLTDSCIACHALHPEKRLKDSER